MAHDQFNRWYLDPITGHGYPEDGARAWGWRRAEVLDGDMDAIAAPLDFMGVNYYCRDVVRSPLLPPLDPPAGTERTAMGWEVYPAGLTETLEFVASRTGLAPALRDRERSRLRGRRHRPDRRSRARELPAASPRGGPHGDGSRRAAPWATSCGRCSTTSNGRTGTRIGSGSSTSTSTRWSGGSAIAVSSGRGSRATGSSPPRLSSVVVDRQAGGRFEEVQSCDVDDQFDRLPLRRRGPGAQPCEEF